MATWILNVIVDVCMIQQPADGRRTVFVCLPSVFVLYGHVINTGGDKIIHEPTINMPQNNIARAIYYDYRNNSQRDPFWIRYCGNTNTFWAHIMWGGLLKRCYNRDGPKQKHMWQRQNDMCGPGSCSFANSVYAFETSVNLNMWRQQTCATGTPSRI